MATQVMPDLHRDLIGTYSDFLNLQRSLNRLAASTRLNCLRVTRTFLIAHPRVRLDRMTPEHIERHLVALGISPRSMQTELMRLRAFFRWCVEEHHLLKVNPCDRVHRPRWFPEMREAVTEEELVRLCRQCRTLEEVVIVEGLYHTGLRVSEFRHLRVRDLDLEQRTGVVVGKGGRPGVFFFLPHVADLFRAYREPALGIVPLVPGTMPAASDWFLPTPRRPGLSRGVHWIERLLGRLGRAAGLPYPLTAHLMRHGLARSLKLSECPLSVIQQILRHSNIQTTINLYGRLRLTDVRAAYDRHMRKMA